MGSLSPSLTCTSLNNWCGESLVSGLITFHWEISQNIKMWDDRKNTSSILCASVVCFHAVLIYVVNIELFLCGIILEGIAFHDPYCCDLAPQHLSTLRVHTFSYPSSCPSFQLSNYEKKPTRTSSLHHSHTLHS